MGPGAAETPRPTGTKNTQDSERESQAHCDLHSLTQLHTQLVPASHEECVGRSLRVHNTESNGGHVGGLYGASKGPTAMMQWPIMAQGSPALHTRAWHGPVEALSELLAH